MKNNKKTIIIVISIIIVIIVAILAGTYAWYVWQTTEDETTKIVTSVGAATIYYDSGSQVIGANIRPVSEKENGIVKTIQVKTDSSNNLTFDLYLDIDKIDSGLQHESFRYAFYKASTLVKEGNFTSDYINSNTEDCTVNTGVKHIILLDDETVSTTLTTYTLYIWIDGKNYTNPTDMQNKNFNFTLHATGEDAVIKEGKIPDITETIEGTLAYTLVNMYNNAEKSDVTNNGILYHYDTEHNLMSDIAGNLRYYGATPNNYIYFNCSDYSNQSSSTCELWRIIGVFGDKVKIIRDSSIGNYSWDYTSTGSYDNNWSDSTLMTMLNNGYYNNSNGVTYYNNSTTATTINFATSNIGLKNDTTRNMIETVTWNLGGWNTASGVYSNKFYEYERGTTVYSGRPTTWTGKIALMYPSDYGYATDFNKCTKDPYNYDSSDDSYACRTNDWLFNSAYQWLLTPDSGLASYAWLVYSAGYVRYSYGVYAPSGVRPVFYLNSELSIGSGTGTSADPYRISV